MPEKFKPIEFPKDELAHDNIIEWWYFNGLLQGPNGHEYAFMNCLFRADVKKVKIPFLTKAPVKILYFNHAQISDLSGGRWYPAINFLSLVSPDSFSGPLLFINYANLNLLSGFGNSLIEETEPFVYRLKNENLDLKLVSLKKPLLQGGQGFLEFKNKKAYYYSLTHLKTQGRIKVKDKWVEVTGKSWMDHQWANSVYSRKDKWTWFSLQLDNDVEMICFEYESRGIKNYLAGISRADGRPEHVREVKLAPLGLSWISPKTKAAYPLAWNIKIAAKGIDLTVEPRLKEQEMIFGSINYWEGPFKVSGRFGGQKVSGRGFMELVGYPSKYTNAKYIRDELGKTMGEIFSRARQNIFNLAGNIKTKFKK